MRRASLLLALAGPLAVPSFSATDEFESVTLSGMWSLALDPDDRGEQGLEVTAGDRSRRHEVWLPGSIQQQGWGEAPSATAEWTGSLREEEWSHPVYAPYREEARFKMPFWLQPDRVYVGAAWYERSITIPEAWAGQRVSLFLERTHWTSAAWLDGRELGTRDSLSVPHVYDLGDCEPGEHRLRLRIDNRLAHEVGVNAHSVSDHTQGNWNGVIGRIELHAMPRVRIDTLRVTPHAAARSASVEVAVENDSDSPAIVKIHWRATNEHAPSVERSVPYIILARSRISERITLELGEAAATWDEFHPQPYRLEVRVESEFGTHSRSTAFGLRDLAVDGTRFTINGRPIFLRGTLDCCIYPLTGYPPMDAAEWERILGRVREFGLNHVRFHSWCPPRAAFVAADRLGVYLQVEGPFWVNSGPRLGVADPIDGYVYDELDRILGEYGDHPSFLLMAYGNEPAGPGRGGAFLGPWLEHVRERDPRRLYTGGAGWPVIEENEYHNIPEPRLQQWGAGLGGPLNAEAPRTDRDYRAIVERLDAPIVSHEIGQWCAFPDFGEMAKYTGHLRPKNFEIFRDLLADHGLGHRERDFLMASGALQLLCYQEEIEACLRTPGLAGFQLLDLHDFPGQGTALVGVLDPFWDPKPYVTAERYRAFCSPTVPLARLEARTFRSGEVIEAALEVSHFGARDIEDAIVEWSVADDDEKALSTGRLGPLRLPTGQLTAVGALEIPVEVTAPTRATLRVHVKGTDAANEWGIWLYPREAEKVEPAGVYVAKRLDPDAEAVLQAGGTVLLFPRPATVRGGVAFGFSPGFWNYAWTDGQPPHTLGILVDPDHPVFDRFPTAAHTDWQWWEPLSGAGAMVIDELPRELEPLVQPIDTWFRSRRLATLFEARVGAGKLVVCTLDLESNLDQRPAARQLRDSLRAYLGSPEFEPHVDITTDSVRALFREPTAMERLGATIEEATSWHPGFEPHLAIDGDPATMWHTSWASALVEHPHAITVRLEEATVIAGLAYTPRATEENGKIARFFVHARTAEAEWGEPIVEGAFTRDVREQIVRFDSPVEANLVRLTILSSLNAQPHTAVAELRLLTQ